MLGVIVYSGYGWLVNRRYLGGEVVLSGFLVAVLIAVWAVVLVPMWAHRQSPPAASETSRGARVITRRSAPRQRQWPPYWLLPAPLATWLGDRSTPPRSPARAAMVRRRRTTLAVLTGAWLVAAVGVVMGLPSRLLLVVAAPYVGYLIWLRWTAIAAAAHRQAMRQAEAEQRAAGFRDFEPAPSPGSASDPATGTHAITSAAAAPAASAAWPSQDGGRTASQQPVAGSAPASAGPSSDPWLPVALPLPSYVTAAPAPDLIDDEAELAEEMGAELDGELPGEASAYALGEEVLRRRAVGD